MAKNLITPGVYIEETNAFPNSVVEVATAVPAFIGYTEKASKNGKSLVNQPIRITSIAEYHLLFGGAFNPKFTLDTDDPGKPNKHKITINGETKAIHYLPNHDLYMYRGIQLFFNNGGNTCYIVSVGTYGEKDKIVQVQKDILEAGLNALLNEQEPTIIVIPDAVKLKDDCYELYKKVLAHCAEMQNRVAILDNSEGYDALKVLDANAITKFREQIGTENLNYAAAYYPWLNTNIVRKDEITYENLDASVDLNKLLPEFAAKNLAANFPVDMNDFKIALIQEKPNDLATALISDNPTGLETAVKDGKLLDGFSFEAFTALEEKEDLKEVRKLIANYITQKKHNYHSGLEATSPTYSNLLEEIREITNILPPSSAMAGIYTMVDNSRGVWKSPANISLNSVIKPAVNITHEEQENLNVDAVSGKSINAIRTFPGIGTLVWGGRTLDGNSLDWKYINVRRTMIMLEQSIKLALRSYVFEPNDANTWVSVKSMIVNFLTEKWKQGALAGASSEDAFDVQVGLGTTMTGLDILEGKMLVSLKLAIVRPAEFIVITFEQQMQKS
ncbi:MAG TPA: phage tail sheath C-terminal domain-containing protein [Prolixibacteraceae bacterium]|nr:phage tail sheath C-terminal domain-containing protein [Prolixibacteraceae bacterium]